MVKQEVIEEVNVEWDMESCPFPVMYVNSVKEKGNAWIIATQRSHSEYKIKIDKYENLLYNINNKRKE